MTEEPIRNIDMLAGPTPDECTARARVMADGVAGFAVWYPQMGGYVSTAFVSGEPGACFSALVWSDGEFPFADRLPARLHHCMPSQFVRFGETVQELLGSEVDD